VRNHNDDHEDRKRVGGPLIGAVTTLSRQLAQPLPNTENLNLDPAGGNCCALRQRHTCAFRPEPDAGQQVQSSSSVCWVSRRMSPGLIPGPANTFPATSATASASSPSCTGTLFRTNSTARCLSASYARKFRTKHGFPSESKVVTRTFQPAGILATYAPHFRDVKTRCVIIVSGTAGDVFRLRDCHNHL
jgi:hypothetical protein